jgi:hypothetical protein
MIWAPVEVELLLNVHVPALVTRLALEPNLSNEPVTDNVTLATANFAEPAATVPAGSVTL